MLTRKKMGQTLIEVMVTLLFLAIGVIALIRFQSYLGYDTSLSQQRSDALLLATKQIETLRDFQVLNNTAGFTSYQNITSGISTITVVNTYYTIRWTITPYLNPTYKNVIVTVSWTDKNGQTQSVELNTDIAGIDPSNAALIL